MRTSNLNTFRTISKIFIGSNIDRRILKCSPKILRKKVLSLLVALLVILTITETFSLHNLLKIRQIFTCTGNDLCQLNHGIEKPTISSKPNILLVIVDDLGWNDIGYNNPEIKTPFIDKLAFEGVRLHNYYVQPACSPSRAQLLTGKYQIHMGIQHDIFHNLHPTGLPLNLVTLPDMLRKGGYATHLVGKWHLGHYKKEYLPNRRGFDTFYGFLSSASLYFQHVRCESFNWNPNSNGTCGYDFYENERVVKEAKGHYSTDLFVQRSVEIVKNHSLNNPTKPLFLELSLQAVHDPLEIPAEYEQKFKHVNDTVRRKFVALVSTVDDAVKNVVKAYKESGLWSNTLLIFMSDNGGNDYAGGNNYPLRGRKGQLWEGGIRGISFVHGKGLEKTAGSVCRELLHISDWFPTLVNLAGLSCSNMSLDGYDMWTTLSENIPSQRKEILHNIDPLYPPRGKPLVGSPFDTRTMAAIRVGKWKLLTGDPGDGNWYVTATMNITNTPSHQSFYNTNIYLIKWHLYALSNVYRVDTIRQNPGKNVWLFDIEADPTETKDLSTEHPQVVSSLLAKLAIYNSTSLPCYFPPKTAAADPNNMPGELKGIVGPWM